MQTANMPHHDGTTSSETQGHIQHASHNSNVSLGNDVPPASPAKFSPGLPLSPTSSRHKTPGTPSSISEAAGDDTQSYFNPFGLQRTESVYSLSRGSLGSQIHRLTSLQLPDAATISANISAIPAAPAAAKVLSGSADQIRQWIRKAMALVKNMNAEDDVEWAAAGGREGLSDIDGALARFEGLIGVYVTAIEEVQQRKDISSVPGPELQALVAQMEQTLEEWNEIRNLFRHVKEQVELAMEWEELWENVLGDIAEELEALNGVVFEMEEKRHRVFASAEASTNGNGDGPHGLDLGELETIVEDSPLAGSRLHHSNRMSLPSSMPSSSPLASPGPAVSPREDSGLLALFARMQPLRASLDFLPMRLSAFQSRAESVLPTACEELNSKRKSLEQDWKTLQADAESLRKELGEDRWVGVFRNAGRQAQNMCDSARRSMQKLREAIEKGSQTHHSASFARKIESFEAKKTHYGPAIERVLAIIEKGVSERLTINGEIIRLKTDMQRQWRLLQDDMKEMDRTLEETASTRDQQLRDSISSSLSVDPSGTSVSGLETPGSSPASSIVVTSYEPSTPQGVGKLRPSSRRQSSLPRPSSSMRNPSLSPSSATPGGSARRTQVSRFSTASRASSRSTSPSLVAERRMSSVSGATAPASLSKHTPGGPFSNTNDPMSNKPRWNTSTNTNDSRIGHNFKPLSVATPSPYRKNTPSHAGSRSVSRTSKSSLPIPSPLGRGGLFVPDGSPAQRTSKPPLIINRPASSMALTSTTRTMDQRRRSGLSDISSVNSSSIRPPSRAQGRPSYLSTPSRSSAAGPASSRPASSLGMSAGRRSSVAPPVRETKASQLRAANGANTGARSGTPVERPRWKG